MIVAVAATLAHAQRGISVNDGPAASKRRVALVIGNGGYASNPLRNPVNDARAMAQVLGRLGFAVTLKTDVDQRDMERAINRFGKSLPKDGVALFFYAGHGLQINGRNYLIPIGKQISDAADVKYDAVDAGRVVDRMEQAHAMLNIVILDACRDNPFRGLRSGGQGLAAMTGGSGTIIAFATSPGSYAADGSGNNGVYTGALVRNLARPGLSVEQVFKRTAAQVQKQCSEQIPWFTSSFTGDFYFQPGAPHAKPAIQPQIRSANSIEGETAEIRRSAEQGDAWAQCKLGFCYFAGIGVSKNVKEAVRWFGKADEQGHPWAPFALLFYYYDSGADLNNYEEAQRLADKTEKQFLTAKRARSGVSKEAEDTVRWFRKSAEQGNVWAQGVLGACYMAGEGVSPDSEEGMRWVRKAAEQGNAWAQLALGICCQEGMGGAKDKKEGAHWIRKAAEQGIALAQVELAYCYNRGEGVAKDYKEAVRWFRKAAEQGYNPAMNGLGLYYAHGQGVPEDEKKAVRWWHKGIEQGCTASQHNLGVNLQRWREAAERGRASAQYAVGYCYEYGIGGVAKDVSEAVHWYRKAASAGDAEAYKARMRLDR